MEYKFNMQSGNTLANEKEEHSFKEFIDYWQNRELTSIINKNNDDISSEVQERMNDFSRNDKSVKVIIDQKDFNVKYISENLTNIFGYTKEEFNKSNILLFFKALTFKHKTFPLKAAMWIDKNLKSQTTPENKNIKLIFCGIQIKDKARKVRTLLIRYSVLKFDERKRIKTVILSLEDISHLVKSDFYWMRMASDEKISHSFSDNKKYTGDDIISDREKDVLRLIAKGMESKEIAQELFISSNTVDNHRKNMIARTGARDTTALLHLCISCSII